MVALVSTLFTAIGASGTAAAGAAGAAAATGAAAAGSGFLSTLATVGTVFSAVASIGAGIAGKQQADAAAEGEEFEAKNEFIKGRQTSADLKSALAKTLGDQAVTFAAGGVDLSSVSVGEAKKQATKDAETELASNSNSSLLRMLQRRRAAANERSKGDSLLFQGIVGGASSLASGLAKAGEIG